MKNIIFEPMFYDEAVKNQVKATKDRIDAEKNDKRTYAREKLISYAFKNRPFGVDGNGCERFLNMDIKEYYYYFMENSKIEIMVVGNIDENRQRIYAKNTLILVREGLNIQKMKRKKHHTKATVRRLMLTKVNCA